MIRLDKYLSEAEVLSRSQASDIIRAGRLAVDGKIVTHPEYRFDEKVCTVTLDGRVLTHRDFLYLLMNKPEGYISSTDDPRQETVLSLLPAAYRTKGLFPAGRLDKDTVGLLILTNDGKTAHRLLSPKHHVEKVYAVKCDRDFLPADAEILRRGVMLDGKLTKPCGLSIDPADASRAEMTLTEGKFHEIKRLCAQLGKSVVSLERIRFGPISLDPALSRGMWRNLTDAEVSALLHASDAAGGSSN